MELMNIPHDSTKENIVLSPLADPVVAAIFESAEVAGKAACSLIRVVLSEGKMNVNLGEVVTVTPQRVYTEPRIRGCRVDVEVVTANNEIVVVEVQLYRDKSIFQRNLFAASKIFARAALPGTSSDEMAERLPRVIVINILTDNIREDNTDIVQPLNMMYTKAPHRVAMNELTIYNIQLARYKGIEPDLNNPLHCWFYPLYRAHSEGITLKEVIEMTPLLQAYAAQDEGFRQFCERYGRVSEDPKARDDYYWWINAMWREQGERDAAFEDGAKNKQLEFAARLLKRKRPIEEIIEDTGLTRDELDALRLTNI